MLPRSNCDDPAASCEPCERLSAEPRDPLCLSWRNVVRGQFSLTRLFRHAVHNTCRFAPSQVFGATRLPLWPICPYDALMSNPKLEMQQPRTKRRMDAEVGRRVHMLMWDQQLTQTAFGARVGIDQSTLAKKLRGSRGWSLDDLAIVASALGVTMAYLLGEVGTNPTPPISLPDLDSNQEPIGSQPGAVVSLAERRARRLERAS